MLRLAYGLHQLQFGKLMSIYEEENEKNGALAAPQLPPGQQILQAEQSFYQYLAESFFPISHGVYAIWEENGNYRCALRLETYEDGLLLAALETAPQFRRMGYAEMLIKAVHQKFEMKIYSHVEKRNISSLRIHEKCGFRQIKDDAHYIDGSFSKTAVTFCYP